ncbi:MAG: MFS transporter [Armatimonadota bacterium]
MTRSRRIHHGWIVLLIGTLVVFASLGLARFGYSMVLPAMQDGLAMDNTQAGALATANLIGYLALSAIGGALASRLGPRVVIAAGLFLAGASMLLTGVVTTFLGAALWRTVTGIGSGASNVPVMGLMAAWFSARRRGLAAGVAVAGSSVALIALGPSVPAVLGAYADSGWRVCWWLFGTVTIVLAGLAWALLRNCPEDVGLRPVGCIEDVSAPDATSRPSRLNWSAVYRAPAVWHLGLVYVAFGFSYIIYLTFFMKLLVAEAGYTDAAAGNLFMLMGWFSLLCGVIWGHVSDVIGRKGALVIVYLIQALAFGLFTQADSTFALTASAILFGLTAWSIPAVMAAACGDVVGPKLAPAALGFVTLFFGVGQAAGPTVAGAMADTAGSLQPAMLLAAGVAVAGALGAGTLRTGDGPTASR